MSLRIPSEVPMTGKESYAVFVKNTAGGAPQLPHVVIIGGGFAGLYAAKRFINSDVTVTLVDRKNHHTFQPLLYQVATTVLSPGEIASPLRRILNRGKNIAVLLDEVVGFDVAEKRVLLKDHFALSYDYLIVAAGARHSYFGNDAWEKCAPGLKTIEDAVEIRRRVLLAFEQAERETYLTGNIDPIHFAIVGGGPTGVELAGAIAGIARQALAKDFKAIDTTKARVLLFEGSQRILNSYPEELSQSAEEQLEELGVEVYKGHLVTAVESNRIQVRDEWIHADVTLWATGIAASPLGRLIVSQIEGGGVDTAGRVVVQNDLSVPGRPEIFVLGDMASVRDGNGRAVPGLGAAATQEGKFAAATILNELKGGKRTPFVYRDRGNMATIGRNRAVAQIGSFHISGIMAWALWLVVHVFLLIGFRNRFSVMREWVWAYFTRQRSAQLITGDTDSPLWCNEGGLAGSNDISEVAGGVSKFAPEKAMIGANS